MDLLGSDIDKIAAAFSTFAGVLAGFVFAFMGYLLGTRLQRLSLNHDDMYDSTLSWSVLAFVSLSVASFLFALLSGQDRFSNSSSTGGGPATTAIRPLVMAIFASGTLTIAILVLLLALVWLFWGERTSNTLAGQLRVVVYLSGLMTLFYLVAAFNSVAIAQRQFRAGDLSSLIQSGAIFALAIALGELLGFFVRKSKGLVQFVRIATQSLILVVVFACAGIFNLLDTANEAGNGTWHTLDYEWWGIGALGVVLFLCIVNLPGRLAKNGSAKD